MTDAISVTDLHYHYPSGAAALRGVTLRVPPGQRLGLVGPNGAGKSTLLLHLNGLLPGGGGAGARVAIDGLPAGAANLPAIRRKVGMLFQDPDDQLFCDSVFDDVAFGPRQFGLPAGDLEAAVAAALAQVGMARHAHAAPHQLSAGEKRRVCLAGVLACQPSVLVLDEPTAGLDPRGRRELKALLRALPCTQIIATHDLEFVVEVCSQVLVLDQGRIIAGGPARDILGDEPLMLAHGLERPHILLPHHHPA